MTIHIKEWTQREWTQPNVDLFRDRGDFYDLFRLTPSLDHRSLKRSPGWSDYAALTDAEDVYHIYVEASTGYLVFIGQDDSKLHAYVPAATPDTYQLSTAIHHLGGLDTMNVLNWGGHLYVIGDDGDVYRSTGYGAALTNFYGSGNALALAAHNDRVYLVNDKGKLKRLKDDDSAFETFYDVLDDSTAVYFTSFRGYLLLATLSDDGTLVFYRADEGPVFESMAQIPGCTGANIGWGSNFCHFDDCIYFSPGRVFTPPGDRRCDVYRYDGSRIELVARKEQVSKDASATGLITWQEQLLFYELHGTATEEFKLFMLLGDSFAQITEYQLTYNHDSSTTAIASIEGQIVVAAENTDTPSLGYHVMNKSGAYTLSDGYYISSNLDMGSPSRAKRLEQITVIMDAKRSNFNVIINYRCDDSAAWITAATTANTKRVVATALGASFYTMQLRIQMDDDSGVNFDARILGVSVLYTIED